MLLVPMQSIGLAFPVFDDNKKQAQVKKIVGGVERTLGLTETKIFPAGEVIDLQDKKLAKELLDAGLAREADPVLDGDDV